MKGVPAQALLSRDGWWPGFFLSFGSGPDRSGLPVRHLRAATHDV